MTQAASIPAQLKMSGSSNRIAKHGVPGSAAHTLSPEISAQVAVIGGLTGSPNAVAQSVRRV
jgi:hypothetical protein